MRATRVMSFLGPQVCVSVYSREIEVSLTV